MKRLIAPLGAAFAVALTLSVATAGHARAGQPASGAPPGRSLDRLTARDLLDALDEATTADPDRAMSVAHELWRRRTEIPRRDILAAITDTTRTHASRELMVDLLAALPEDSVATDDARALLRDEDLDGSLKARVVVDHAFGPQDSALLGDLAAGPDDDLAFHALKKLGKADPAAAGRLALATVARADAASDMRLSAAYKVLVRSGALDSDRTTKSALLRHLAAVLAAPDTSPELCDSAAFALADMRSLDALRILLESGAADAVARAGAVDQNAALIRDALRNDPDAATIELAVTAMELHPVTEIAAPLGAVRERIASPELVRRLDAALARIARDGAPLNPKWTED